MLPQSPLKSHILTMTSKILFVILIGCAVTFAAPTNNGNNQTEEDDIITDLVQSVFGNLYEKIGGVIHDTLQKAFDEIGLQLDTEEYRKAITELQNILKVIYGNKKEHKRIGKDDEKLIEQELEKVSVAFNHIVEEAIEKLNNKDPQKVDAQQFKVAVENLKTVFDRIYPKQGSN